MSEGDIGADVALSGLEDMVHSICDALGDLLPFRDAALLSRLNLRCLVYEGVRGLVARGAALGKDEEVRGVSPSDLCTDIMPEIGGDVILTLDDLRGASEVEDEASELGGGPGEEHFYGVVLVSLDVFEVRIVGPAIHFGIATEVRDAAVVADDGMAECPTHAAGLEPVEGFNDGLCDILDEEIDILGWGHYVATWMRVPAIFHLRGCVSVRGVEEEFEWV